MSNEYTKPVDSLSGKTKINDLETKAPIPDSTMKSNSPRPLPTSINSTNFENTEQKSSKNLKSENSSYKKNFFSSSYSRENNRTFYTNSVPNLNQLQNQGPSLEQENNIENHKLSFQNKISKITNSTPDLRLTLIEEERTFLSSPQYTSSPLSNACSTSALSIDSNSPFSFRQKRNQSESESRSAKSSKENMSSPRKIVKIATPTKTMRNSVSFNKNISTEQPINDEFPKTQIHPKDNWMNASNQSRNLSREKSISMFSISSSFNPSTGDLTARRDHSKMLANTQKKINLKNKRMSICDQIYMCEKCCKIHRYEVCPKQGV